MYANQGYDEMNLARSLAGRNRHPQQAQPPGPLGPSLMNAFPSPPQKGGGVQVINHNFTAPPSKQQIAAQHRAAQQTQRRPRQPVHHPMNAVANFTQDMSAHFQRWGAERKAQERKSFYSKIASQFDAPEGIDPKLWQGIVADRPEEAVAFLGEVQQANYKRQIDAQQAAAKRQADLEDYRVRKGIDREFEPPEKRETAKGADGRLRYLDTGELAFPDVEKAAEAPTVKKVLLPDGSEAAVQWDPNSPGNDGQPGAWVPIDAPEGGRGLSPKRKLTENQSKLDAVPEDADRNPANPCSA